MNKKILKIASAISALNFAIPITANAMYKSFYTTGIRTTSPRTEIIGSTSDTPAAILARLRQNRNLGKTTILQSTSIYSNGFQVIQPYTSTGSRKIQYKNIDFIH